MKVALTRPIMMNNTTHRPATIQRIRIGATPDGKIVAIAHESTSGNLPNGRPETAVSQTRLLYAGPNRLTAMRLAELDLPEGNAMRAPGEAPGLMALEIAMDEMAEKLEIDPIALPRSTTRRSTPRSRAAVLAASAGGMPASGAERSAGTSATRAPPACATGTGSSASASRPGSATTCS